MTAPPKAPRRPSSEPSETSTTAVLGSTEPRLYTPPLVVGAPGPCGCGCALTPATSYGFAVDNFARDILEKPLDPWERFLVIHAGELLPDGTPRFRKVLVIVARQNGKTHVLVVLSLYWLFVARVRLVLGTSTNLDYAKESWEKAVELVEEIEELAEDVPLRTGIRRANGEQTLKTVHKSRYKIAASNRKGGRSLTVGKLILDELREHQTWEAWNASYNAMNAVPDAQAFGITNQGDKRSVVLISLRSEAVEVVDGVEVIRADGDPQLGLFEWSAPPGSRADDPYALASANPNLGRRIDLRSLLSDARRAIRNGGEELATYLTEILCMQVDNLDPAYNGAQWSAPAAEGGCLDVGDMTALRGRTAMVLDVTPGSTHATLVAAAQLEDGRVRVEPVAAWTDMRKMRRELPGKVAKAKKFGWFPDGPAAAFAADLAKRSGANWPPKGVEIEEIRSDVPAVCMGFGQQIEDGDIAQSDDPLMNMQVKGAEKLKSGDRWRLTRRGDGNCDAAYAAAGAVHLARTLPVEQPPPRSAVY